MLVVVALVCVLLALLYFFERKWGAYIVQQSLVTLNESLCVPVSTSGVEFTFFANFPHASLHLRDVTIPSAHPEVFGQSDTLLVAQSVFLTLNPFELLKGRGCVESFRIVHGYLNLRHSKTGVRNYDLVKPTPEETPKTAERPIELDIREFRLDQMVAALQDEQALLQGRLFVPELTAKFSFQGGDSYFRVKAEGLVESARQGDFIFAQKQHFRLGSSFQIVGDRLETQQTRLNLDRNEFEVAGFLHFKTRETEWRVRGEHLDLRTILAFASQYKWQLPPSVDLKGELNAELRMKGLGNGRLGLDMDIWGEGLALKYFDESYTLKLFRAHFTNGNDASRAATSFDISQCELRRKNSTLSGKFRMTNLDHPHLYAQVDFAWVNNEVMLPFLTPYIERYSFLRGTGECVTSLQDLANISPETLINPKLRLDCDFSIDRLLPNPHQLFSNVSGAVTINNEDLIKGAISGEWNKAKFDIGVNVQNVLSLFRKGAPPQWTVNAKVAHWDIPKEGLPVWNPDAAPSDSAPTQKPGLWEKLGCFRGDVHLSECSYRGALLDSVQAHIFASKERLQVDLQNAYLLGGRLRGDLSFSPEGGDVDLLRANLFPERVDLRELFLRYDDFGLKNFGHRNLSGQLSGNISLHLPFFRGTPHIPDLQLRTRVTVYNGELNEVDGLEALSTFIKLDELRHIRFSTLSNEISVLQQKITVPQMLINSSALSLRLQGEQYLDSRFLYRLQLSLSDLLFHRLRAKSRSLDEDSYQEDGKDGGVLYLILQGDSTGVQVSYDRKALADRYRERVAREKEELRDLFNEEFHLRPAADSLRPVKEPSKEQRYRIEWEELDSTQRAASKPVKQKPSTPEIKTEPKKEKPTITWEDD